MHKLSCCFMNLKVLIVFVRFPLLCLAVPLELFFIKRKLHFSKVFNTLFEVPPDQIDRPLNKIHQKAKHFVILRTDTFLGNLAAQVGGLVKVLLLDFNYCQHLE